MKEEPKFEVECARCIKDMDYIKTYNLPDTTEYLFECLKCKSFVMVVFYH